MVETQNLLSRGKMKEYILYDYVVNHWEKLLINSVRNQINGWEGKVLG